MNKLVEFTSREDKDVLESVPSSWIIETFISMRNNKFKNSTPYILKMYGNNFDQNVINSTKDKMRHLPFRCIDMYRFIIHSGNCNLRFL